MSVAPGLEYSYNSACPGCGLAGWEHREGCEYDAPASDESMSAPLDPLRPITDAEMAAAVDRNAKDIAKLGGRYGEPARGDDAIGYNCCYCGGTFDATPTDIAHAHDMAAQDGLLGLSDADAFRDYGRDMCDEHQAATVAPVSREDCERCRRCLPCMQHVDAQRSA